MPHQCAHWFAMTWRDESAKEKAPLQGELAFVRYEQMTEGLMEDCISINPSGSPFATHLPYEGRL